MDINYLTFRQQGYSKTVVYFCVPRLLRLSDQIKKIIKYFYKIKQFLEQNEVLENETESDPDCNNFENGNDNTQFGLSIPYKKYLEFELITVP